MTNGDRFRGFGPFKLIRHYLDLNLQFTANISPTLYLCDTQLNDMGIRTVGIRTNSNILKSAMMF